MQNPLQRQEFALKETSPNIGARAVSGGKLYSAYVEQMQYVHVWVVKAKELPAKDVTGSCDPYVEVKLGNYQAITTKHFEKKNNPEWNQLFSFLTNRIKGSVLEVVVKDKDVMLDDFIGRVMIDFNELPIRLPLQWYRLEDREGVKVKGELMLAVWMGNQADEAFPIVFRSEAPNVGSTKDDANIRSYVYLSPRLWYLRVKVIEAQDLQPSDKSWHPEVFVKAVLGNQALRTRTSQSKTINPMWNEDLIFVAAEPFEESLVLTVEDRVGPNKDEVLRKCMIPLQFVERWPDHKPVNSRWYNLQKHVLVEEEQKKETQFASRIHLRIILEGGYHVFDESTHYSSDVRPAAKQLWRPSIGILRLVIHSAHELMPMKTKDGRGTTDAYCVAKYGQKWVRTRTIVDSFFPEWNERDTWEVFDPCTVITIGVFDNGHIHGAEKAGGGKDVRIGKVRIRLSTLVADRIYRLAYPLFVLDSSGVKRMGEVRLAVKFTCSSFISMWHMYSQPLLPKMHYIHPLSVIQLDSLRQQAIQIVSMRLNSAEPPLRKEVVEYMLDVDSHMWSMRRSKANLFRIMGDLRGLIAVGKWFDSICNWKNPLTTIFIHILFVILVHYPKVILSTIFLFLFWIGIINIRWKPRHPPHLDSYADAPHPDELDAGRVESLISWRDPRATTLFITFCFIAATVLYVTSFQVVALLTGFYVLRHPWFRPELPSVPLNFFRRLPATSDCML